MSERKITDVSNQFQTDCSDGESLPVTRCMCGAHFCGWGDFVLDTDSYYPKPCPLCGRKFYWRPNPRIYMVEDAG